MFLSSPTSAIRGFLLDMDGTFYLGDHLLPGAREFLAITAEMAVPFLFLSNNSSKNRMSYVQKMAGMGLEVEPEKILVSGEATAQYLQTRLAVGTPIAVFGTPDLEQVFFEAGFSLDLDEPNYIVLGFDTTITYAKLTQLCNLVRRGLPYIATHPDYNCPVQGGYIPDIGAMIAFVEASTGRKPDIVIGKPNRHILDMAAVRLGLPLEALCMVGDRLYTDIALGQNTPVHTALVLTGETKREDLSGSAFQPDYVFEDLAALVQVLNKARGGGSRP